LKAGAKKATGPKQALARIWCLIAATLDGDFSSVVEAVVWMPAHKAVSAIGVARDSPGAHVTPSLGRRNRLVDAEA
jgi:hypothetical protein